MVTSVSDNSYLDDTLQNQTSQPSGTVATAAKTQPQQDTQPPKDQVKLSVTAQAQALKNQGQSVSQIAQSLGVSTAVVDQLLGISDSGGGGNAQSNYSASQVQQLLNGV